MNKLFILFIFISLFAVSIAQFESNEEEQFTDGIMVDVDPNTQGGDVDTPIFVPGGDDVQVDEPLEVNEEENANNEECYFEEGEANNEEYNFGQLDDDFAW